MSISGKKELKFEGQNSIVETTHCRQIKAFVSTQKKTFKN